MTYWGVICKGELLIFRRFGDREPRIALKIDDLMGVSRAKPVFLAKGGVLGEGGAVGGAKRTGQSMYGGKAAPATEESMREFTLRSGEMHKTKFVFSTPNKRECWHWFDVLEYWINKSRQEKRKARQSFQNGSADNISKAIPTEAELAA